MISIVYILFLYQLFSYRYSYFVFVSLSCGSGFDIPSSLVERFVVYLKIMLMHDNKTDVRFRVSVLFCHFFFIVMSMLRSISMTSSFFLASDYLHSIAYLKLHLKLGHNVLYSKE